MSIRIQCVSCQRTFQVPGDTEGKQTRCPGCQTLILIKRPVEVTPDTPAQPTPGKATPVKATPVRVAPVKATPVKATPVSSATPPSHQNDSIYVFCRTCSKQLRVPGRAAGKAIRCPGCQATIPVPIEFSIQPVPVQAIPTHSTNQANAYPANPLHDESLWSSIPPASASVPYGGSSGFDNPYASSNSYSSGGTKRGSSRASRVIQYNIIGVLMMIWSGIIVMGCIIRPIAFAIALSNLPPNQTIDYGKLTPVLIGTVLGIAIGLAIAYVMFQGGYNIFHQADLPSARQTAIFCAIPCCGSCLFPVGIWACILLYGRNAERDFSG